MDWFCACCFVAVAGFMYSLFQLGGMFSPYTTAGAYLTMVKTLASPGVSVFSCQLSIRLALTRGADGRLCCLQPAVQSDPCLFNDSLGHLLNHRVDRNDPSGASSHHALRISS